ncbi:Domain of uncharacterised function (DUF955) [Sebaldella termitidis]|uniref:IrrE N-terminal-like domain-containing protein n=1 Tax=Sebaldella termitidis (strain ATCC 33386 / NCTC 11300) TaxID=526218 RepID=D1AGP0_SEBTE|nr:ImmA/IrrE family metallo-endopeptidase [Sebaldella termitidis]ACZ10760.1 protein of unknown function DUF955 [Sebaldella termitidis ATCC 33386]SUI26103.1 Domain of uncharacterised function (DUF955) [Sebaldella termitidis]
MKEDIFRRIANNLIVTYGTNDPFKLAKYLNIQVLYLDFKSWLGMFSNINGVRTIFINNNLSKVSQIVVCDHELGHSFQPFKESVFMKEKFLFENNRIEAEANIFAATLIFSRDIDEAELTETDKMLLRNLEKYKLY